MRTSGRRYVVVFPIQAANDHPVSDAEIRFNVTVPFTRRGYPKNGDALGMAWGPKRQEGLPSTRRRLVHVHFPSPLPPPP